MLECKMGKMKDRQSRSVLQQGADTPMVSITVPVYNVSAYLRQCLNSILGQTITDWECIVIDDGSTDDSALICDEYARKDARFHVFHKTHGGLSSARQWGLEHAHGKYLVVIDSDDWVESNHLETMLKVIQKSDADIAMIGYFVNTNEKETFMKNTPESTDPRTLQKNILTQKIHSGLWNKIFRRAIFTDYDITPAPYDYAEDMFTILSCLQFVRKIVYQPSATYHYRYNPTSLSKDSNVAKRLQLLEQWMRNIKSLSIYYQLHNDPEIGMLVDNLLTTVKKQAVRKCYKHADINRVLAIHTPEAYSFNRRMTPGNLFLDIAIKYNVIWSYRFYRDLRESVIGIVTKCKMKL